MDEKLPRHTSTRTSLEHITRKLVDQAADELLCYLEKLPEFGRPAPDASLDRVGTCERVTQLHAVVRRYLGSS